MAKLILAVVAGLLALSFCVGAALVQISSGGDNGTLLLAIGCGVLLVGTGITSRLQAAQK